MEVIMDKTKFSKLAKVLDRLFAVISPIIAIATGVAIIILAVLTIVNAVDPNAVIGSEFNVVDVGEIDITLDESLTPSNGRVLVYAWIDIVLVAFSVLTVCYALHVSRRILSPIALGNPFADTTGKDLRKLGFAAIAVGVASNVKRIVSVINALNILNVDKITEGGVITAIESNFSFDYSFLIVFAILFLLSYVFEYGRELQELSDETL